MLAFKTLSRRYVSTIGKNILQHLKKNEDRFEGITKKMNVINCDDGVCLAEMKVEKEHSNIWNGLHGGMSATLVDMATSIALINHKNAFGVPSVSVDMHLTYLKQVNIGEEIIIDAKVVKVGKSLGFATCEIRNKATGDVVVKGTHTKFIMNSKLK